jgi:hypothetical protein
MYKMLRHHEENKTINIQLQGILIGSSEGDGEALL